MPYKNIKIKSKVTEARLRKENVNWASADATAIGVHACQGLIKKIEEVCRDNEASEEAVAKKAKEVFDLFWDDYSDRFVKQKPKKKFGFWQSLGYN